MKSGAQILRKLRQARGETMEHIAVDARITYKALSEIERGITKQPSRENLYSILDALDQVEAISGEEWQAVFAAYGYKKPYPLPTEHEIERARQQWRSDYEHIVHPAYLIDCSQRLLDWNRYAPRLLGIQHDDIRTERFKDATVFDLAFGLAQKFVRIENRDEYLSSFVYTTKGMLQLYKDEPWYAKCILTAQQKYPEFQKLWDSFPDSGFQASLTGLAIPIVLGLHRDSLLLRFQLVRVDFVGDERFWIVQWIPVDAATIQKCHEWAQDECYGNDILEPQ